MSPEQCLDAFYTFDGTEDMLMDPLILAGRRVIPLVIKSVANQEMPRRRYAILFLGNSGDRQSLPVFKAILENSNDLVYCRGDALESIYMIDRQVGEEFAVKYAKDQDYLGMIASDLLNGGKMMMPPRTYGQALRGCHDCY